VNEAVIDASALVDLVSVRQSPVVSTVAGFVLHAPHLIDVEVAQALRGLARAGSVETAVAASALRTAEAVVQERYGHAVLLDRIWELRANLSAYDATYVALAELLDLPLITADARLATAPGVRCRLVLV
jgi:predicted nucleic acid-binding protein